MGLSVSCCSSSSKILHAGPSTYGHSAHRCEAVARRARALLAEYAAKARYIDQQFCGTAPGSVGPLEVKLRTYDPVRGLVFGAWGEASPDVERLLTAFSRAGAAHHWHTMQVATPGSAQGILAWLLRRRWGMTAMREAARLKLERLEFVGRGAAHAADRRGPRLPSGGRGDIL